MIQKITLENFLSFRGPTTVELKPLNIIIGANGVGKSNFIHFIEILQSLPTNLEQVIRRLGGEQSIYWKGKPRNPRSLAIISMSIEWTSVFLHRTLLNYSIDMATGSWKQEVMTSVSNVSKNNHHLFYREADQGVIFSYKPLNSQKKGLKTHEIRLESLIAEQSLFQQVKGPQVSREITIFSKDMETIRIHGHWDTSHSSPMRQPCPTDRIASALLPDASNLPLVVGHFESKNVTYLIEKEMQRFNPRIRRIAASPIGNATQIFFSEDTLSSAISATSVSDGTLQYLALLCVLLNPNPAPLVCFEEPECGLHPDAIPLLADLLRRASEKMQIIVTTHSDRLVDCFSDAPECVLVAERDDESGETLLNRLDPSDLKEWLEKYRLGKLWTKGQIGGVIR